MYHKGKQEINLRRKKRTLERESAGKTKNSEGEVKIWRRTGKELLVERSLPELYTSLSSFSGMQSQRKPSKPIREDKMERKYCEGCQNTHGKYSNCHKLAGTGLTVNHFKHSLSSRHFATMLSGSQVHLL